LKHINSTLLVCGLIGSTAISANAAGNLLVNGSFETGDFTGWTQSGNLGYTGVYYAPGYAEDGNYYVDEGPVGSDGFISQTFTDTPGQTLVISGWFMGNGEGPSDFGMYFDGTAGVYLNPVPGETWTNYTFDAIGTGSDTFSVGFRQDPGYDQFDNFSVTPGAATPGPAAIAPFALGLFGVIRRRRSA
jgi:MYXO-CTERM domain-containing protein